VFWTYQDYDRLASINLWRRAVPTVNEYSQLVTPQALYINKMLFKQDVSTSLNRFSPWIGPGATYDVVLKTFQALGVRYMVGYGDFPDARDRGYHHLELPRRSWDNGPPAWQIYETPDPNLTGC
jgi:hypothetical protein